jgi:hypothetical protein
VCVEPDDRLYAVTDLGGDIGLSWPRTRLIALVAEDVQANVVREEMGEADHVHQRRVQRVDPRIRRLPDRVRHRVMESILGLGPPGIRARDRHHRDERIARTRAGKLHNG